MKAKLKFNSSTHEIELFTKDEIIQQFISSLSPNSERTQLQVEQYIERSFQQCEILEYNNNQYYFYKKNLPLQLKKDFTKFKTDPELYPFFLTAFILFPLSFLSISYLNKKHNDKILKNSDNLPLSSELIKYKTQYFSIFLASFSTFLLGSLFFNKTLFAMVLLGNVASIFYSFLKYKDIAFCSIYSQTRFETKPFTLEFIDEPTLNKGNLKTTVVTGEQLKDNISNSNKSSDSFLDKLM